LKYDFNKTDAIRVMYQYTSDPKSQLYPANSIYSCFIAKQLGGKNTKKTFKRDLHELPPPPQMYFFHLYC